MLISFIAFLACFELPRSETIFGVDQAARLAWNGEVMAGHVTELSTSGARMNVAGTLPIRLPDRPVSLYLDALGWIEAEVFNRSETSVGLRLRPTSLQHRQLVVRLFGAPSDNVADTASLSGAIMATIARGFRGG
jgi:cellulose synthase (UDP-forming)